MNLKQRHKYLAKMTRQKRSVPPNSDLSPQLVGLEGQRVEVTALSGETRQFYVGKSTGRNPHHLEVRSRRYRGAIAAEKEYESVLVMY